MNRNYVYDELSKKIDKSRIISDAPMKDFTSFKVGGNAALLVQPKNVDELSYALDVLTKSDMEHIVMGNGTNILVKDSGFKGAVIKIGEAFNEIKVTGNYIEAGAGALLSAVANAALEAELTGFEFAGGIPGSIGGAVFMNAGAYDGEISEVIESAEVLSNDGTCIKTINKKDMALSYRHSIFHKTEDIIIKVKLNFEEGKREDIRNRMRELSARRTEKQPLAFPSAGSFFKRPHNHFAGKLIQDAGLRGLQLGGAQISDLHAGFIINKGGATATDIINLMEVVRNTVFDEFGIMLEPEVKIIGD